MRLLKRSYIEIKLEVVVNILTFLSQILLTASHILIARVRIVAIETARSSKDCVFQFWEVVT